MKPSNFTKYPYNSVFKESEYETVAVNIMVILKRTGDKFRSLSWGEYKSERELDGNFSLGERLPLNVCDLIKSLTDRNDRIQVASGMTKNKVTENHLKTLLYDGRLVTKKNIHGLTLALSASYAFVADY